MLFKFTIPPLGICRVHLSPRVLDPHAASRQALGVCRSVRRNQMPPPMSNPLLCLTVFGGGSSNVSPQQDIPSERRIS